MRLKVFDIGGREGVAPTVHDRVLTVANLISVARLAGLPVFAWLVLGPRRLAAAFGLVALVAATDWVDGYVARRFDQVTRLGKLMDPLIDRLLFATVGVTLVLAGILPLLPALAVVGRDTLVLVSALALLGRVPPIDVTRTGKFATATLMVGLPAFLLAAIDWSGAEPLAVLAWGFTVVGLCAYYVAGVQYLRWFVALRRARRQAAG